MKEGMFMNMAGLGVPDLHDAFESIDHELENRPKVAETPHLRRLAEPYLRWRLHRAAHAILQGHLLPVAHAPKRPTSAENSEVAETAGELTTGAP